MTPKQIEKFKKQFAKQVLYAATKNSDVPKCSNDCCDRPRMWSGNRRKDGSKIYKTLCSSCNSAKWITKYTQHKKDYCENIDGRLGYKCKTTIIFKGQLQVDHVDGNPSNNVKNNLQTLCACCHIFKTHIMEDSKSPGRKALGITK